MQQAFTVLLYDSGHQGRDLVKLDHMAGFTNAPERCSRSLVAAEHQRKIAFLRVFWSSEGHNLDFANVVVETVFRFSLPKIPNGVFDFSAVSRTTARGPAAGTGEALQERVTYDHVIGHPQIQIALSIV